MRKEKRPLEIHKLDEKQKFYRRASEVNRNHGPWLRKVREALGVTAREMAVQMNVRPETIFRFERSERKMSPTLGKMDEVAHAMGCKLTYSIVPVKGTLAELAEAQAWKKRLKRQGQPSAEPRKAAKAAPEEEAERMEHVGELLKMGAAQMSANQAKTRKERAAEPEGMTEKEKSLRRILARMEAEASKSKEGLRELITRQIEQLRRERVGGPPLQTKEEEEVRLRKAIEEAWKRPEPERPKSEPVELHRFTLEEAERNVKRFERWLEEKTQGPEKGTPAEIANLERGIEWFQKIVEERKREAQAAGAPEVVVATEGTG